MSLVVTVVSPDGIIMGADSRQFASMNIVKKKEGQEEEKKQLEIPISSQAYKLFLSSDHQVGVSFFGQGILKRQSIAMILRKFKKEKLSNSDNVKEIGEKLLLYFHKNFPNAPVSFHLAGFFKDKPYCFVGNVKKNSLSRLNYIPEKKELRYGCFWGGEGDILSRFLNPVEIKNSYGEKVSLPHFPIIWETLSLQDGVDFVCYAIRLTEVALRFQARPNKVGGDIDILLITPEETIWVARKKVKANFNFSNS